MGAQHVVILGAGASLAALPKGDRNGRRLPLMSNFVEVVGLEPILSKAGIDATGQNFGSLYSRLALDSRYADCTRQIERAVFEYFGAMRLPDHPTLYDHLVLSLREKDLIATFNWDPFLIQAIERLPPGVNPPQFRFLHGCVGVGFCPQHEPVPFGRFGMECHQCGVAFMPSRLLYPVTQKNYNADPFCAANWRDVRMALKSAYLLTLFGYGAPSTDVEAVSLLHEGWGEEQRLGNIEIIDIRPENELRTVWGSFIKHVPPAHVVVWKKFYSGWFARHPRRSGEAFWKTRMQCDPPHERPIPEKADWDALHVWAQPLLTQEAAQPGSDT